MRIVSLDEKTYSRFRPYITMGRKIIIVRESREKNLAYFRPLFIYTLEFFSKTIRSI